MTLKYTLKKIKHKMLLFFSIMLNKFVNEERCVNTPFEQIFTMDYICNHIFDTFYLLSKQFNALHTFSRLYHISKHLLNSFLLKTHLISCYISSLRSRIKVEICGYDIARRITVGLYTPPRKRIFYATQSSCRCILARFLLQLNKIV